MITLTSNRGRTARINKGYVLKDGIVQIPRDRLRALGKAFHLDEFWHSATDATGKVYTVVGVRERLTKLADNGVHL